MQRGKGGVSAPTPLSAVQGSTISRFPRKKLENLFPHCNTQLELTGALSGQCECSPLGPHTSSVYICFSCLLNTTWQAPVTPAVRFPGSSSTEACILGYGPMKSETRQVGQKGFANRSRMSMRAVTASEPISQIAIICSFQPQEPSDRSRALLLDTSRFSAVVLLFQLLTQSAWSWALFCLGRETSCRLFQSMARVLVNI